ncbi:MAG: hypothetical protein ABW049_02365, partial [Spongiibacteraceae bacterium]
ESAQAALDLAPLQSSLIVRSTADVIAGGGFLLQTFFELLSSLIGLSLSERLLRPVGADLFAGPPAQDISP